MSEQCSIGGGLRVDDFRYCHKHSDLWQSDCPRCEECCQHWYGMSVKEKFNDGGSYEQRSKHHKYFKLKKGETFSEMMGRARRDLGEEIKSSDRQ